MRTTSSMLAISLALLTGCYAAHEGGSTPRRDAGPVTVSDGGPIGRDGSIHPPPAPRDGGPPPTGCSSEIVEPYAFPPPCSEEVNMCFRACIETGGEDCVGECLATEPECQRCFYENVISCANDSGCLDRWRELACCTDSVPACAGLTGVDRFGCAGSCPEQIEAYGMCVNAGADACLGPAFTGCGIRLEG